MTVTYSAPSDNTPQKKSRTALLPLLIVLFLISYSILTMLVIEQGRTIESQRVLLREMLKDSNQLAELKGRLAEAEAKQAQAPAQQAPASQAEGTSAQVEKAPAAATKAPAAGQAGKTAKHPGKTARKLVPEKPEADLEDVRRSTRVI